MKKRKKRNKPKLESQNQFETDLAETIRQLEEISDLYSDPDLTNDVKIFKNNLLSEFFTKKEKQKILTKSKVLIRHINNGIMCWCKWKGPND